MPATERSLCCFIQVKHRRWRGIVWCFGDGRFIADHNGDEGRWFLDENRLALHWDRWPVEVATSADGERFQGAAMECMLRRTRHGACRPAQDVISVIIVYRDSGADRRSNLMCVANWYSRVFPSADVHVVEQDKEPHLKPSQLPGNVNLVFTYQPRLFNRAWGFNVGSAKASRDLLLFSDADVVMTRGAVEDAVRLARWFGAVKPYWKWLSLDAAQTARIRRNPGLQMHDWHGKYRDSTLCGGAILLTRRAFDTLGGWPEEFEGWGYEDSAQGVKVSRLLPSVRLPYRGYHLWHGRTPNDSRLQPHYGANAAILQRIKALSRSDLAAYVARQKSKIGNPRKFER